MDHVNTILPGRPVSVYEILLQTSQWMDMMDDVETQRAIGAAQQRSTMILGSAAGRGSDMKRQRGQGVGNLLRRFDFGALE